MSRRLIVPATLLSLLGILSCEKSEVVSPVPSVFPASEIAGTIVGWNLGDSMSVSAAAAPGYGLATGAVRHDGSFYLSMPTPSPAVLLSLPAEYDSVSDPTARILVVFAIVISNPDQSVQYVAYNEHRASPESFTQNDYSFRSRAAGRMESSHPEGNRESPQPSHLIIAC